MTKTYEQARDEAAGEYCIRRLKFDPSVHEVFKTGADFGRDWERKRSEKLVKELKQIYVYSGDLLITEIAGRALAEYKEGSET
jgi:hypothetical protein